ncbi:MAG: hypothetical protein OHK0022_22960 [Roseiflexaceae bacterium]
MDGAFDAIDHHPDLLSGAWVFRGTRVPVAALFENMHDGVTVDQFLEWFPGVTRAQVEAVLSFVENQHAHNHDALASTWSAEQAAFRDLIADLGLDTKQPRRPGSAKGMIHMSDDFDAPLDDFREYTQ